MGLAIIGALTKGGKHNITALSRAGSKSAIPDGVKTISVDYSNESQLVEALKGQQMLIISLAVTAPPETQGNVVAAAAKAGVPCTYHTPPM